LEASPGQPHVCAIVKALAIVQHANPHLRAQHLAVPAAPSVAPK
jgi:hypothetical protein